MICVQLLTLTVAQFKNNVAPLGMTGMPQRGESCGVTCVGLGVKPYGSTETTLLTRGGWNMDCAVEYK